MRRTAMVLAVVVGAFACDGGSKDAPQKAAKADSPAKKDEKGKKGGKKMPPPVDPLEEGGAENEDEDPVPTIEAEPHFSGRGEVETTVSGEGEGPYEFTAWWHKSRIAEWERALKPYVGRKDLAYLEVGVFEGRSLLWVVENVMTDPGSRATAIDIFMDEYEATFDANIAASGAADRITKIKEPSQTALRKLPLHSFDVIYIDGSHTADDVLADAVLSWDLLRENGLLIFDDYNWQGRAHGGGLPPELLPKVAIDAFVVAHRYELETVAQGAQLMVRKLKNPCEPKDYCSPVGQYLYFWRDRELRDAEGKVQELSPDEVTLIETIAKARRDGEVDIRLDKSMRDTEAFKALKARLSLDLRRRKADISNEAG